ncbi:MAG: flagellar motor protein MotB [Thermodesulfobacteriota bacterium]
MARKQQEERPDWVISNVGLVMFTALNILLLAFFIMLSSMAVVDEKRQIEAFGSLLGAFGILPGGLAVTQSEGTHIAPPTSPMQDIVDDMQHIRAVLSRRILADQYHLLKGSTRQIISLESAVLFPPDGVELLPETKPVLLEIARIVKDSEYPLIIEGHTDDQPPRTEKFRDNWEVSSLRAVAVLKLFLEEGGIAPERLSAYGYAGNKPAVANTTPRNRARNNRIDIILDFSHQKKLARLEARRAEDKVFDFKGFIFRLFD